MRIEKIKYLKTILLALLFGVFFSSCDEETPMVATAKVTFNFTHNFDGSKVTSNQFNLFDFINSNKDTLSITKLRYLVSDIRLYKTDGDSIMIEGYNLVDVTNSTGLAFVSDLEVPQDTYTGISFVFGFDEMSNIDNAYADLNAANWNWPSMLGGGYHFMQMEGKYLDNGAELPYAYHNGMARVSDGVFEQNYFMVDLGGVTLDKAMENIEIQINIAEWYRNPYTWEFSTYSIMLMPNYAAQKLMQSNGESVFSLGNIE